MSNDVVIPKDLQTVVAITKDFSFHLKHVFRVEKRLRGMKAPECIQEAILNYEKYEEALIWPDFESFKEYQRGISYSPDRVLQPIILTPACLEITEKLVYSRRLRSRSEVIWSMLHAYLRAKFYEYQSMGMAL